jgi:hypothetical protein
MNENAADIGELIEPAPIGFSFDAPGWYALAILIGLLLLGVVIGVWIHHVRNRYRRDALRFILTLENDVSDKSVLVYEVNMLLKRIALRFVSRDAVASLRNEQWIDFLNKTAKPNLFSKDLTRDVFQGIYNGSVQSQHADSFLSMAKEWVNVHKNARKNHKGTQEQT